MNPVDLIVLYYKYALIGIGYLFLAFVFVMFLKRKYEDTALEPILKIVVGIPAVLFDWLMNMFLTPLFWDLPGSWHELVTGRLKRYIFRGTGKRYRFAKRVCDILDRFDPSGDHC